MKYDGRVCKFNMDTGCVELLLRAFCPVPGAFCVREAAFSENAAKLQKKLQFSHQKRRFPIDSLVIIGV